MNILKLKNSNNKTGFTIIEVVLVLAIAGLIFLTVFLALPTLQRSQRDTQRKEDMSRVKAAYDSYKANNKGKGITDNDWGGGMPVWNQFLNMYLKNNEKFNDPSGAEYRIEEGPWFTEGRSRNPGDGVISLNLNTVCGQGEDGRSVVVTGNKSDVTIRIRLEGGGVYCLDMN